MKKYLFIVIVIFLLISLILCGCFGEEPKTDSDKLIGSWNADDSFYRSFEFFSNGSCTINGYNPGTYHINEEGKLVINQTAPFKTDIYEYHFSNNNKKLTLKNDWDILIFTKQ